MHLNSPAIVLDVPDMAASRDFLQKHLGFEIAAAGDGFAALGHPDHGMRIIFRPMAPGLAGADGKHVQIGFLVTDIDAHWAALKDQVIVSDPVHTDGATRERSFQMMDGNGILYRLIEFV
jgi:catechol 2,3-dioxygenase-like lactoylglutathione lyase family enzyme